MNIVSPPQHAPESLRLGWSDFALGRHCLPGASVRFKASNAALIDLVQKHWASRKPGAGRNDLSQVVIVPIEEADVSTLFTCGWIRIEDATDIRGEVVRRQSGEHSYVQITGVGPALAVTSAQVVLYSAATLLENDGKRSGDFDWEIVALIAGPWANEPMVPLTMARNFLSMPGGTFVSYSSKEFAESVYFWSGYVQRRAGAEPDGD